MKQSKKLLVYDTHYSAGVGVVFGAGVGFEEGDLAAPVMGGRGFPGPFCCVEAGGVPRPFSLLSLPQVGPIFYFFFGGGIFSLLASLFLLFEF